MMNEYTLGRSKKDGGDTHVDIPIKVADSKINLKVPPPIPHRTAPYHTILYHTMPYRTAPHQAAPYHTMTCHTTLRNTPPIINSPSPTRPPPVSTSLKVSSLHCRIWCQAAPGGGPKQRMEGESCTPRVIHPSYTPELYTYVVCE